MASSGIPPDNEDKNLLDPADGIDAQNTSSGETPGDALIPSPEIFAGEHEQANEIQLDEIENIDVLAFEDALDNDSIGLTTKDAQNEASNDA